MLNVASTRGTAAATCAYLLWGLLPIYWKALDQLPAYEILGHRMAWSLFFVLAMLMVTGRLRRLSPLLYNSRIVKTFCATSVLLGANWLIYIWAVNSGYIVEASLGYYINPLVTVSFGIIFFSERLRPGQLLAIGIAAAGVIYLTVAYGRFPWISLALAMTFASYGLLHKKTSVGSLDGLCLETLLFFLPAALLLVWIEARGGGSLLDGSARQLLLLIGTGLVTTVPLLLFGYAAQNIPLSLLGVLQYSAPTLNLLLGVFVYHEEFPQTRLIGFLLVWTALLIYLGESGLHRLRRQKATLKVFP